MKRLGVPFALAWVLAGCGGPDAVYRLVVDRATISTGPAGAATNTAQPASWCSDGSTPSVAVVARTRWSSGKTSTRSGTLDPVWNEGVLMAARSEFAPGVRVDVVGQCPNGEVHVGAARITPGSNVFNGRSLDVKGYGGSFELQLRLQLLQPASDTGGGYYYDGGYYEDDPSYVSVDYGGDSSGGSPSDTATCDASGDCYDSYASYDDSSDGSTGSDGSDGSAPSSSDTSSGDSSSGDGSDSSY